MIISHMQTSFIGVYANVSISTLQPIKQTIAQPLVLQVHRNQL